MSSFREFLNEILLSVNEGIKLTKGVQALYDELKLKSLDSAYDAISLDASPANEKKVKTLQAKGIVKSYKKVRGSGWTDLVIIFNDGYHKEFGGLTEE